MTPPLATPSQIEELGRLIRKNDFPSLNKLKEEKFKNYSCMDYKITLPKLLCCLPVVFYKDKIRYQGCQIRAYGESGEICYETDIEEKGVEYYNVIKICDWKILNEDRTDCTAEHQTEETILAIIKLLS